MTQRIPLTPSDHDVGRDRYIARYDGRFPYKFDFGTRTKPDSDLYQKHDAFFVENNSLLYPPLILPSVAFADLNLRTRGLIGVVLGSVAKHLVSPPKDIGELNSHRDLDVLVLQPHSPHHPAPNEWFVDWFVRPLGNKTPTNGRVELWYDFGLIDSVETAPSDLKPNNLGPLALDLEKREIRYDPSLARNHYNPSLPLKLSVARQIRENVEKIILPPGLYLLDSRAFRQVIRHCNKRAEELQYAESYGRMKFNQDRLVKLANRFRQGKIGIEKFLGELAEIRRTLKEICKTHATDWPDAADFAFDQLFFMAANGNPAPFKQEIGSHLSKLEELFRHNNWDYLDFDRKVTLNALYPILPSEFLTFRPL